MGCRQGNLKDLLGWPDRRGPTQLVSRYFRPFSSDYKTKRKMNRNYSIQTVYLGVFPIVFYFPNATGETLKSSSLSPNLSSCLIISKCWAVLA